MVTDPEHRAELGEFLRSRRARRQPIEFGLAEYGRRRVPGLRREELARLAGISVEYYERLERGRAARPSDEVVAAAADALRLDAAERAHLWTLARPPRTQPQPVAMTARDELLRLLTRMASVPALVMTDTFTVLAANPAAHTLFRPLGGQHNLARSLFLDPAARTFYVEWAEVAASTVAQLRIVTGRYPRDTGTSSLLGELSAGSTEFARLWAAGDVEMRGYGSKRFRHPESGIVTVDYENFELPGDARQRLVAFTPVDPENPVTHR